jgi:hypothetical protein
MTQNTNISINWLTDLLIQRPKSQTVDLSIDWLIHQSIQRRDGGRDFGDPQKDTQKQGPPQNPGTQILPDGEARQMPGF